MLVQKKELEKFTKHASQAAALDYIISVESDVFVPSYTGNMARAVEGHRRFLGHRKTINPDRYCFVPFISILSLLRICKTLTFFICENVHALSVITELQNVASAWSCFWHW